MYFIYLAYILFDCPFIKVNFIKANLINCFYKCVFKIVKYLR